jgi:hypothetical protein
MAMLPYGNAAILSHSPWSLRGHPEWPGQSMALGPLLDRLHEQIVHLDLGAAGQGKSLQFVFSVRVQIKDGGIALRLHWPASCDQLCWLYWCGCWHGFGFRCPQFEWRSVTRRWLSHSAIYPCCRTIISPYGHGAIVSFGHLAMAPSHHSIMICLASFGTMATLPRCNRALCCNGSIMPWQFYHIAIWQSYTVKIWNCGAASPRFPRFRLSTCQSAPVPELPRPPLGHRES